MKAIAAAILAFILVLTVGTSSVLAAGPVDREYRDYLRLSQKIERLQRQIPEGRLSDFPTKEQIRICRVELKIVDLMEKKLTYEERHDLPRSTTWSAISNTRTRLGIVLEELLVQKRGG